MRKKPRLCYPHEKKPGDPPVMGMDTPTATKPTITRKSENDTPLNPCIKKRSCNKLKMNTANVTQSSCKQAQIVQYLSGIPPCNTENVSSMTIDVKKLDQTRQKKDCVEENMDNGHV